MGDFYELFDDDARVAARDLHITLTSREFGKGERTPMAGIPYHALDSYLAAVVPWRQGAGLAAGDVTTGALRVTQLGELDAGAPRDQELARLAPAERLVPASARHQLSAFRR